MQKVYMIINQPFCTLKGTTTHLDKCCANRVKYQTCLSISEVPPILRRSEK